MRLLVILMIGVLLRWVLCLTWGLLGATAATAGGVQFTPVAKDLKQRHVAEAIDKSESFVGQIERGEKNISFENLTKISSVLGVSLSELVSGLENNERLPGSKTVASLSSSGR